MYLQVCNNIHISRVKSPILLKSQKYPEGAGMVLPPTNVLKLYLSNSVSMVRSPGSGEKVKILSESEIKFGLMPFTA